MLGYLIRNRAPQGAHGDAKSRLSDNRKSYAGIPGDPPVDPPAHHPVPLIRPTPERFPYLPWCFRPYPTSVPRGGMVNAL
jgi:hypothetical protein